MQRSADRFLTTHVGSLPRPDDLVRDTFAQEEGVPVDHAALDRRVQAAVPALPVVRGVLVAIADAMRHEYETIAASTPRPGSSKWAMIGVMARRLAPDPGRKSWT